jgi:hypothetical protein
MVDQAMASLDVALTDDDIQALEAVYPPRSTRG